MRARLRFTWPRCVYLRHNIAAALLFSCAPSLHAQPIRATLNRLADGVSDVRIQNNSSASLIAYAVLIELTPRDSSEPAPLLAVFADPLVDEKISPLAPGQYSVIIGQHRVLKPARKATAPPATAVGSEAALAAGIFDNDETAGDAALLRRLILRRANTLLAVENSLETLLDAGRRNISRSVLIAHFQGMAQSLRRWYLPSEQQIGAQVYQEIAARLINLPETALGEPFPPTEFTAKETAALNRRRVALLESQPSLAQLNSGPTRRAEER
jgi:hypothetical protein